MYATNINDMELEKYKDFDLPHANFDQENLRRELPRKGGWEAAISPTMNTESM